MGLRERKKEETRRRIEQAALRLFEERGFEATSVEVIAAEAEVSPRTVFRYFERKHDLVLGQGAFDLERLRGLIAARPAGEPAAVALREAILELAAMLGDERETVAARARLVGADSGLLPRALELREHWAVAVAETLAARDGSEDGLAARSLASAALAALSVAVREWADGPAEAGLPPLAREALDEIGGLRAER